ncbi:MAG TPA: MBL fold metallo-hydrolase [Spirochaetota bacterium]|nr:MBL fold metallo-hydrolase [Spirochaetota bacterium]
MEKLTDKIKLLSNGKYRLPYCNCLLIEDEITCLIDSSPTDDEFVHLDGLKVDLIVNSHSHTDHNSRNNQFAEAKILLHPAEHARAASGDEYLRAYGFDLYNAEDVRPLYLAAVKYAARPADGEVTDNQVISTGSVEFQVLHLPGHTYGHCGFIFQKEGFIFTADIHPDIITQYAMLDSSVDDFISSIKKLMSLKPDTIVAGHGKAIIKGDIQSKLAGYIDEFYSRDEKILERIRAGKHTVQEIADDGITFKGNFPQPRSIYWLHECIMDLKHLEHLERLGEVVCENRMYYTK